MNRQLILTFTLFLITGFLRPAAGIAEELSVEEIVARTNHMAYYKGRDGRAQVHMTITDEQGRERNRQFTILRLDAQSDDSPDQSGEQYYYVYFHRPADVNKTVFMVWKHIGRDDDRWLYLPALDLVKRIAASDERTSFVGSHFFYEDVSGRGTEEDSHKLLETTDTYYVLENVPKNPDQVAFSSYTMWIHRDTFLPVKIEYFDRNNKSYRVYQALEVREIEGYQTVTRASMADERIGGKTVMSYERVDYDIDLPQDIFSERYLRQPPRKYLR